MKKLSFTPTKSHRSKSDPVPIKGKEKIFNERVNVLEDSIWQGLLYKTTHKSDFCKVFDNTSYTCIM